MRTCSRLLALCLFLLAAGCGGGAGVGTTAVPQPPPPEPVDLILNGPDLAGHTQHWALTDYGSGWDYKYAFFADGTGAFHSNPGLNPGTEYAFTWTRNGPASLSISGPAIMGYNTLTFILGATSIGQFTALLDGNPTARTFSLRPGALPGM